MEKQFSLLVVEDQKENIDILVHTLEEQYEIFISMDGEHALNILEHINVDLILLDIQMPKMNGYEVCKAIKESNKNSDTPIIFLSGMDSFEDKKKGFDLGAVDYITKPFSVKEVNARIKAHIRNHAGKALIVNENKILLREVDKKGALLSEAYLQLEQAYLETIERLSRAAEYMDDETGLHVKRVGKISAQIAKQLGLSTEMVHAIEHAAPLHDIGKMGIPEGILLKPGKLNAVEWEIMKTHAFIGKNILMNSSSNIINMAEIIAYSHHERWDGTGYPLGLKKEQIPMVSRIVAVADVFDALLSKRPYKRAYSFEEAINVIVEEMGTHFSPEVANAFLLSLDEIESISNTFKNQ